MNYKIKVSTFFIAFLFLLAGFANTAVATTWMVQVDDGFQRADTAASANPGSAGNSWIDQPGNRASIHSNLLRMNALLANDYVNAYLTRPTSEGSADERIVLFTDLLANTTHWPAAILRWSSGNGRYYCQYSPADPSIKIFYLNAAGSPTQIGFATPAALNTTHYYALDCQVSGSSFSATLYDQGTTPPSQTGAIPSFGTQLATFTVTDSTLAGSASTVQGVAANAGGGTNVTTDYRRVITYVPLPTISLTSPSTYQVFQRNGVTGSISISGTLTATSNHDIEANFNGGAYQTIATNVSSSFSGRLTGLPQGEGTVNVRLKDNTSASTTVANVGIGDVFVIAGQSNASGRATNNQTYTSSSGYTASLYGNDNVWHNLTDPTDTSTSQVDVVSQENSASNALGSSQGSSGGSYWPNLATSIIANQQVPVAFIPTALGGTGIALWQPSSNHQDRTTLYGSMVYRALATGGVRGVLWHQGETDAHNSMSQSTYTSYLQTLAAAVKTDLGVRLYPAKIQSGGSFATQSNLNNLNSSIGSEWQNDVNVAQGADLSGLTVDDGFAHLQSNANMNAAALLWWTALSSSTYAHMITVPSTVTQYSSNNTLSIYGTNTDWTSGTPGSPTFSISGGNASITSQSITSSTTATITVNAGTSASTLIVTDPSSNATTSIAITAISTPTVTTSSASASDESATLLGNITSTGGVDATQSGFAYGTDSTLSSVISTTTNGSQIGVTSFSASISGLTQRTTYYFRAYAVNPAGTSTGAISSFTTNATPAQVTSSMSVSGSVSSQINNLYSMGFYNEARKIRDEYGITTGENNIPIVNNSNLSGVVMTFTKSLRTGMTNSRVRDLQSFLNAAGFTIANSGPGSMGHETTFFGPATTAALKRFQQYYSSEILTPSGLTKPTGFLGAATIKKINELLK